MNEVDHGFISYMSKRYRTEESRYALKRYVILFIKWLNEQSMILEELDYNDIMAYVEHCRSLGNKQNTVSGKVRVIKDYLSYKKVEPNPCAGWHIKRRPAVLPKGILSKQQLEEMYTNYPQESESEKVNKVVLGFFIYQGLNSGQIERLKDYDVNLEIGFVIIRKESKSESRTIKIREVQKSLLVEYVNEIRPVLSEKKEGINAFIIIARSKKNVFRSYAYKLTKDLKKRYDYFINFYQIRASVISNWLKDYNLREVQYMSGHRYISSTERYENTNVDDLKQVLDKLHPLA